MQTRSNNIELLAQALSQVQATIQNPTKDASNPYFKSRYATLPAVLDIARNVLPLHGLSFTQTMEVVNEKNYLVTMLMHTSGQWIKSYAPLLCKDPSDPQKFCSTITYFRRYSLQAIVGIVGDDEDDDGNKASQALKEDDAKIFIARWQLKYRRQAILDFVQERAKEIGVDPRTVIKMYSKNDAGFKKELNLWLALVEKNYDTNDSEDV